MVKGFVRYTYQGFTGTALVKMESSVEGYENAVEIATRQQALTKVLDGGSSASGSGGG